MATTINGTSAKGHTSSQKKSLLLVAGSLLIGIAALMVTNPGKTAYVDYASERLSEKFKQDCNKLDSDIRVGSELTLPTQDLCQSFVGSVDLVGRGAVKLIIKTSTERQNFMIFSIYTTQFSGRTFKTVGIGRNFLTFYHK